LLVKDDGLRAFLWSKKWCLLREQTLTFHKNENTYQALALVFLREITAIQRTEIKPCALEIITRDKTYYIAFSSDEELYSWQDEIYQRSPLGISQPTNFVHNVHVGFDQDSGIFTGLPKEWKNLLEASKISQSDFTKNPQAVLDVLEFYTENLISKNEAYDSMSAHQILADDDNFESSSIDSKMNDMKLGSTESVSSLITGRKDSFKEYSIPKPVRNDDYKSKSKEDMSSPKQDSQRKYDESSRYPDYKKDDISRIKDEQTPRTPPSPSSRLKTRLDEARAVFRFY
jgi:protein-serine/threonine kinase